MTKTLTAKERYTLYFRQELAKNPDVPPNRGKIAARMGWKSSNHSGEMPQIRSELLIEAGFVLVNGRWRKGREVGHYNHIRLGQTIWFDQSSEHVQRVLTGQVKSITVSDDGRWGMTACVDRDGVLSSWAIGVKPEDLIVFPDPSDPEAVERWLSGG